MPCGVRDGVSRITCTKSSRQASSRPPPSHLVRQRIREQGLAETEAALRNMVAAARMLRAEADGARPQAV